MLVNSITSGTFQVTSTDAPFAIGFGDVSKSIAIQGAGPGSGTLISKITEVFDSGSASIADNAFVTVVDSPSMMGRDFRSVFQGMLNRAASATESLAARTVQIPAGTFLVDTHDSTASLFIQDGVIFQGAGIGATRLVAFGGNSGILFRNSESVNLDLSIRDMTLDGAKDFHTGSLGSILIRFDGAEDFDLSNLAIVSASGDSVCITGSCDGTFTNIKQRANDRSDTVITGSTRISFVNVNTTGSLGFGLQLIASPSISLVNVYLSPEGSGSLAASGDGGNIAFVNFNEGLFQTNDINIFGTSVLTNPVDQLAEVFIGTVPFRSKGQAHALQTVSGSRTWMQFPLVVNNVITGSDLTVLGFNPGMALVMDYVKGDNGIGSDEQFMAIMSVGQAGANSSRLTPNKNFGWTAFYTCSLLSGSQCWSGSAFEFKQGHVTAPAFTGSFSGSGEGVLNVISTSFAETASFALNAAGAGSTGSFDATANFSRSFALGDDWQTATSASQDLTTGMWVLSIQTTSGIGHDNITYIGQFFWQADALASTDEQDSEILLHRAGKFAGTGSLFARTFHSASTELALQIKTIVAGESAQDYAFNFRKLI